MKIILCAGISVRSGTNYVGSIFSEMEYIDSIPPKTSVGEFPFFRQKIYINYKEWIHNFNVRMYAKHKLDQDRMAPFFGQSFLSYLKDEYNLTQETLFVKDPSQYNLEDFYKFYPEGKLILLTRSAPDVIASCLKGTLLTRNSYSTTKKIKVKLKHYTGYNMLAFSKAYGRHARQLLNLRKELDGNFLEIKYEDLVLKPHITIKKIFDYCDLNYTEEMLESAVNAKVVGSSYYGAKKNIQNWGKLEKTKDFNPIGRYKSWNKFYRFIYKRYADKGNKLIGYDHNL